MRAEPDNAAAAPAHVPLGRRIAQRLPEIVIEALFMLVAVVLAFAVEARSAILQEVTRNRDELIESRPGTLEAIAELEAWLDQVAPLTPSLPSGRGVRPAESAKAAQDAPTLPDPAVNLELALLSSAAWRTAQSTEASRRMNYTWMLQISQTYELQAIYQDAQSATVEALVTYHTSMDESTRWVTARALLGRVRALRSLGESLEEDYAKILVAPGVEAKTSRLGTSPAASHANANPAGRNLRSA